MDLKDEVKLVEECRKSLAAFSKIYDAYVQDVYRYAYSRLNNRTEAEDITSETFLKAIEKFESYKVIPGRSIKWWFFTIARNLIIDKYRKKDMVEFNEEFTSYNDEKILDVLCDKDMIKRVEEFIKEFKPPVPEIIQLRLWEELSFEEIADILGKSQASVKMAYYRALEKINEEFVKKGVKVNG